MQPRFRPPVRSVPSDPCDLKRCAESAHSKPGYWSAVAPVRLSPQHVRGALHTLNLCRKVRPRDRVMRARMGVVLSRLMDGFDQMMTESVVDLFGVK